MVTVFAPPGTDRSPKIRSGRLLGAALGNVSVRWREGIAKTPTGHLYVKSGAPGHALSVHPTEIRTLITPSSAVELKTTSALANYTTEAGLDNGSRILEYPMHDVLASEVVDLTTQALWMSLFFVTYGAEFPPSTLGAVKRFYLKKATRHQLASELYRPISHHMLLEIVSTFADRRCHVIITMSPLASYISFLDQISYFFIQVMPDDDLSEALVPIGMGSLQFRAGLWSEFLITEHEAPGFDPWHLQHLSVKHCVWNGVKLGLTRTNEEQLG
uniref:Uncharacterized protein n=1 Tax=Timema shepardi TaxID=629360 RepID=A0A7R9B3F1_TIMSH|nr:unnamed protein product [Timema shepardi]